MRRVVFDPSTLQGPDADWWKRWSKRADTARAKVLADVAAGKAPDFNEAIWKDLKDWLLEKVFHGHCAYCEGRVADAQDNPAAEHYRPKRTPEVIDAATGKRVPVQVQGTTHPGYYWLAYAWQNLVPACSQCNSNAKGNLFPVAKAHVAAPDPTRNDPADLNVLESPLLLHPFDDDPALVLCFNEHGAVAARDSDARGGASIAAYNLNRAGLVDARKSESELVWLRIEKAFAGGAQSAAAVMQPYKLGKAPHSRAVLDVVLPRLRARIADLQGAVGP